MSSLPPIPPVSTLPTASRASRVGGVGRSGDSSVGLSEEQLVRGEQRRMVRERWMHLLLLGFALSVVLHVGIMLWLWATKVEQPLDEGIPSVELRLQELPPAVELVTEDVELPDPSPLVVGPVTTEVDPVPSLSADQASDNPSLDSFGAIEAPGVGAIVGPGGAGNGIGLGSGTGGGGTSFFGVGGRGTRFAYVVDVSGSMGAENRMLTAISELKRSVGALPDFAQYYVVLFSNGAIIPTFDTSTWLRATRANIGRTRQWLDEQRPEGGTEPLGAFEQVFSLPQPPDVIFFLTDGLIPPATAYEVRRLVQASKREVVVNTVGFSNEAGKDPLIQIAKENRGVFRFVPSSGGMQPGQQP